ncbi:MAG: hypothetical protein KAI07_00655 [Deltaproteobacteria bacterium]|nr:hypothetical protein [Deltaproteobacteria bacterium]
MVENNDKEFYQAIKILDSHTAYILKVEREFLQEFFVDIYNVAEYSIWMVYYTGRYIRVKVKSEEGRGTEVIVSFKRYLDWREEVEND